MSHEEFANNRQLREFRNFSVKPRWRLVDKHRQNVGKPSFRKLMMEMPVEITPRTALSNFVRVRCVFSGQFRRLVRTKIRLGSIIIRYPCRYVRVSKQGSTYNFRSSHTLGCSETLAHNETDFSRRFGNLQLPSSLIDKNNKH